MLATLLQLWHGERVFANARSDIIINWFGTMYCMTEIVTVHGLAMIWPMLVQSASIGRGPDCAQDMLCHLFGAQVDAEILNGKTIG